MPEEKDGMDRSVREGTGVMTSAGGSWLSRLGWMVGIWTASVAALGVAAWLMRLAMGAAGMHS